MAAVVATRPFQRNYNRESQCGSESSTVFELAEREQVAIEDLTPVRRLMRRTWFLLDDPASSKQVGRCLSPTVPHPPPATPSFNCSEVCDLQLTPPTMCGIYSFSFE